MKNIEKYNTVYILYLLKKKTPNPISSAENEELSMGVSYDFKKARGKQVIFSFLDLGIDFFK